VYDLTPPQKMIAFIIPNESSKQKLQDFVIIVDAAESATGLDFFPHLEQSVQQKLESKIDTSQWQWR
jgi:endonuclease G